jgi:hypothetical protein
MQVNERTWKSYLLTASSLESPVHIRNNLCMGGVLQADTSVVNCA